jgi:hypothetical protein
LIELASKKDGQRLFGPNPSGEPSVKPQYRYLGPNSVWPFEPKLPVKSLYERVGIESGKKVGKLFDEAN